MSTSPKSHIPESPTTNTSDKQPKENYFSVNLSQNQLKVTKRIKEMIHNTLNESDKKGNIPNPKLPNIPSSCNNKKTQSNSTQIINLK